jgi:DNA-binding transcriptional LysR family regulator
MRSFTHREIEVFRAVMACNSVSRAAEILAISQPAATKAIQGLEKAVQFSLFERVKGRLVPTPEGQLLFKEVEQSFIGLARIRAGAARIRDFGAGDIKIASLSAFSTSLVPVALKRFQKKHPNVAITFQPHGSSVVRDLIASGQFDIGFAADEIDVSGIDARAFAEFTAMIALPPGHALCDRKVLRPRDLHEIPFVALSAEDTTRREAEAIFAAENVVPKTIIETPYSITVCAFVLAGLGCGFVDPITAAGFVERGLVLKPFQPAIRFRTLVVFPPDRQKSRLIQDCVECFEYARDVVLGSKPAPKG